MKNMEKMLKCSEDILSKTNLSAMTLDMQACFASYFINHDEFSKRHQAKLNGKMHPVFSKIVNALCQTNEDYHILHEHVIEFVSMYGQLTNVDDAKSFREVKNIVTRMLPVEEVPHFVHFSQKEKIEQLETIALVSSGVQLYNWCAGKKYDHITAVIECSLEDITSLVKTMKIEFITVKRFIPQLEGILSHYVLKLKKGELNVAFDSMKFFKIFLHQYKSCLSAVLDAALEHGRKSFDLRDRFNMATSALNQHSSRLPPVAVSLYKEVATLWSWIKDGLLYTKNLFQLFDKLKNISANMFQFFNLDYLPDLHEHVTQEKFLDRTVDFISDHTPQENEIYDATQKIFTESMNYENVLVLLQHAVKNFNQLQLELQGFCPWSFVFGKGLLLPGHRELGIVMYNYNYFIFNSPHARNEFLADPAFYAHSIIDVIHNVTELILLLNLEQIAQNNCLVSTSVLPVLLSDSSCQTILHLKEKHIENTYRWNLWELREQALKYITIENLRTHSTQTHLSNFRRDNSTQIYLPKDKSTQTRRDTGTNPRKFGVFESYLEERRTILKPISKPVSLNDNE